MVPTEMWDTRIQVANAINHRHECDYPECGLTGFTETGLKLHKTKIHGRKNE